MNSGSGRGGGGGGVHEHLKLDHQNRYVELLRLYFCSVYLFVPGILIGSYMCLQASMCHLHGPVLVQYLEK